jgi:hypothetical protein
MGRVGGVPADVVRVVPVDLADRGARADRVVRTVPEVLGVPVGQAARGDLSMALAGASVVAKALTATARRVCPSGRGWPNGET